jgi:hypothetical protein
MQCYNDEPGCERYRADADYVRQGRFDGDGHGPKVVESVMLHTISFVVEHIFRREDVRLIARVVAA